MKGVKMNIINNIICVVLALVIGFCGGICIQTHNKHVLNDVEYTNYMTLDYKIKVIKAADEFIDEVRTNTYCRKWLITDQPESFVRYCYYSWFLEDNPIEDSDSLYNAYKEDFQWD